MSKNLKYFLIPFLFSLPFWWGANILGERFGKFFYWLEMAGSPQLLASQENQVSFQNYIRELKPTRRDNTTHLEIEAKSAVSIFVDGQGKEKILFDKEKNTKLPIASLTKLMTAKIVLDNYELSKEIEISKTAVAQEGDFGKLIVGKLIPVKYLLHPLLIESSNDAAFALANDYEGMTGKEFVRLMNQESDRLELTDTEFFSPAGLDPEETNEDINYSTAYDLAKLARSLLGKPLLWEILATPKFDGYGPQLSNTNILLGELSRMVGGKTGYTEKALGCFLVVVEAPKGRGYIINVILGSNNRFLEMKKMVNWVNLAYIW